jgi:hypothetical protein
MSTVPLIPKRSFYIRIFSISLVIIVVCLLVLLFGVQMEASVPATGILQARDQKNLRAPAAGLVEFGWYEGQFHEDSGQPVSFRVDAAGNGVGRNGEGKVYDLEEYQISDGRSFKAANKKFQRVQVGDHLWPGQPVAHIIPDPPHLPPSLKILAKQPPALVGTPVVIPRDHALWQVLKVHVENHALVSTGSPVLTVAPIDPESQQPLDVEAHLQVAEELSHELAVGQDVHLFSNVFASRLHGHADARLTRIGPLAEPQGDGKRYFNVVAAVTASPFPLRLGSGVSAKIILGKKTVYRLILEH